MPLRTTARITAFRPGQSPPPVSMPIFIVTPYEFRWKPLRCTPGVDCGGSPKRGFSRRREEIDYHQRGLFLISELLPGYDERRVGSFAAWPFRRSLLVAKGSLRSRR